MKFIKAKFIAGDNIAGDNIDGDTCADTRARPNTLHL